MSRRERRDEDEGGTLRRFLGVYRFTPRAMGLVWRTNRSLTFALAILTVAAGVLPAAVAYVGKLLVDGVVAAAGAEGDAGYWPVLSLVAIEAALVATLAAVQRGIDVSHALMRAQLGHRVSEMILEKALELELRQFEDSEFYDKMTRARRDASQRPLSLVNRSFGLVQNGIALITYGALLLQFSSWAVLVLLFAAIPSFISETKFAGDAFRLFKWRSPEKRKQVYFEVLIAREDHAKEIQLLRLGPTLLDRYRDIFRTIYREDRALTVRRGIWGVTLGLLSTFALYGAYAWCVVAAVDGAITLGEMTMYLLVFKQGSGALSAMLTAIGGMYEDNLYLSTLYEYLEQPSPAWDGEVTRGSRPGDGIRFESVRFTYPGADRPAVDGITLHLRPGRKLALVGPNGSGKTTLIKLLTRLYAPDSGRILLDGVELADWDQEALRRRIAVIFQDFIRYQFTVGENIGVGDVENIDDQQLWREAADKGMASDFIEAFDEGYATQLGRWFHDGRELSLGQWQKIALARAFVRQEADILVLDEPTAAIDAESEAQIFQRFRDVTAHQMAILISHRFSTVRIADEIVVLDDGQVVESGTHEELMDHEGIYSRLFTIQAAGYQ